MTKGKGSGGRQSKGGAQGKGNGKAKDAPAEGAKGEKKSGAGTAAVLVKVIPIQCITLYHIREL